MIKTKKNNKKEKNMKIKTKGKIITSIIVIAVLLPLSHIGCVNDNGSDDTKGGVGTSGLAYTHTGIDDCAVSIGMATATEIVIPAKCPEGHNVTAIASPTVDVNYDVEPPSIIFNGGFAGKTITSIKIPDSVTSINDIAFVECTSLSSITIPDSVISIGYGAFNSCTALTSITIGNGVTSIGDSAFSGCTNLASIIVDANNLNYSSENGILYNKDKTTLLTYPSAKGAVTIPASVTVIGGSAFISCTALTSITIPDSVISIGYGAFNGCTELTNVSIGNGVTSIGNGAFSGCTALSSLIIPNSVTEINDNTFYNCSSLTNVSIGNSVTTIGIRAFFECIALSSVIIPNSVTDIGEYAFFNCTDLTNVSIGNGITTINQSVFGSNKKNVNRLTSVTINATIPPSFGIIVFGNSNDYINSALKIFVPVGSASDYREANNLGSSVLYKHRIHAIGCVKDNAEAGSTCDCN